MEVETGEESEEWRLVDDYSVLRAQDGSLVDLLSLPKLGRKIFGNHPEEAEMSFAATGRVNDSKQKPESAGSVTKQIKEEETKDDEVDKTYGGKAAPLKEVKKVLEGLMNHNLADPFLEPVDAKGLGLDDYHDIVKKPLDLGTVEQRLNKSYYNFKHASLPASEKLVDTKLFYQDVVLVFNNCTLYNMEGSEIAQSALKLKQHFKMKWAPLCNPSTNKRKRKSKKKAETVNNNIGESLVNMGNLVGIKDILGYEIEYTDAHAIVWLVSCGGLTSIANGSDTASLCRGSRSTDPSDIAYYRIYNTAEQPLKDQKVAKSSKVYEKYTTRLFSLLEVCLGFIAELKKELKKEEHQRLTPVAILAKVSLEFASQIHAHMLQRNCCRKGESGVAVFWNLNSQYILEELHFLGPKLLNVCGVGTLLRALPHLRPNNIDMLLGQNVVETFRSVFPLAEVSFSEEDTSYNAGHTENMEYLHSEKQVDNPSTLSLFVNQNLDNIIDDNKNPQSGPNLVGSKIKLKNSKDDNWTHGFVERFRPRTSKHLIVLDNGQKKWFDLNDKSYELENKPTEKEKPSSHNTDDIFVSEKVDQVLQKAISQISIPPTLLGRIVNIYALFQNFSKKLQLKIPRFTFEEFCIALMTKGIKRGMDFNSTTTRLLVRINIALIQTLVQVTSEEASMKYALLKEGRKLKDVEIPKLFSLKYIQASQDSSANVLQWVFQQIAHADKDKAASMLKSELSWQVRTKSMASSMSKRLLTFASDSGWFLTTHVFLESLWSFYIYVLRWDPGFAPRLNGEAINLYALYTYVSTCGGYRKVRDEDWVKITQVLGFKHVAEKDLAIKVTNLYARYVLEYEDYCRGGLIGARDRIQAGCNFADVKGVIKPGAIMASPQYMQKHAFDKSKGAPNLARPASSMSNHSKSKPNLSVLKFKKDDSDPGRKKLKGYDLFEKEFYRINPAIPLNSVPSIVQAKWDGLAEGTKEKFRIAGQVGIAKNKSKKKKGGIRAKTAFVFFYESQLKHYNLNKFNYRDVTSDVAAKWREMSEVEKQVYKDMHDSDVVRVEKEIAKVQAGIDESTVNVPSLSDLTITEEKSEKENFVQDFPPSLSSFPFGDKSNAVIETDDVKSTKSTSTETKVVASIDEKKEIRVDNKAYLVRNILGFNALNELTWQEILFEVLRRLDGLTREGELDVTSKELDVANPEANNENSATQERRGRPRKDKDATEKDKEQSEDVPMEDVTPSDVGEYDLAEEEKREMELWSSIEGIITKSESRIQITLKEMEKQPELYADVETLSRDVQRLLEALAVHPLYHQFEAVQDSRNFTAVVKHPMDLDTILERLWSGYYKTSETTFSLECLRRDVNLIWSNAQLYFKKYSTQYDDAEHLKSVFEERLSEIVDKSVQVDQERQNEQVERMKRIVSIDESDAREEYDKMSKESGTRLAFHLERLLPRPKKQPAKKRIYSNYNLVTKNVASKALDMLFDDEQSEPFLERVDDVGLGLTDYDTIIKKRMDLGLVREKLNGGQYDNNNDEVKSEKDDTTGELTLEFVKDVQLVFQNCRTYNLKSSEIVIVGNELERSFFDFLLKETELEDTRSVTTEKTNKDDSKSDTRSVTTDKTNKDDSKSDTRSVTTEKTNKDDSKSDITEKGSVPKNENESDMAEKESVPSTKSEMVKKSNEPDTVEKDSVITSKSDMVEEKPVINSNSDMIEVEKDNKSDMVEKTSVKSDMAVNAKSEIQAGPVAGVNSDMVGEMNTGSGLVEKTTDSPLTSSKPGIVEKESVADNAKDSSQMGEFSRKCLELANDIFADERSDSLLKALEENTESGDTWKNAKISIVSKKVEKMQRILSNAAVGDGEVWNAFAAEMRSYFNAAVEALDRESFLDDTVEYRKADVIYLENQFESKYTQLLHTESKSKWAWVGEGIVWIENGHLQSGMITDYFAPPKYTPESIQVATDYYKLKCKAGDSSTSSTLNLCTDQTLVGDQTLGDDTVVRYYRKQWAFAKDDAGVACIEGKCEKAAEDSPSSSHAPVPTTPESSASRAVSPAPSVTTESKENGDVSMHADIESLSEADDIVSPPPVKNEKANVLGEKNVVFWEKEEMGSDIINGGNVVKELFNSDYSLLSPQAKIRILEKLCDALMDSHHVRLCIAESLGESQPNLIEKAPNDEVPDGPIPRKSKKRKKISVNTSARKGPFGKRRKKKSWKKYEEAVPQGTSTSTRSGRKSVAPNRFSVKEKTASVSGDEAGADEDSEFTDLGGVTPPHKQKTSAKYRIGQEIDCRWLGDDTWYPAVVEKMREVLMQGVHSILYDVRYEEDGAIETNVKQIYIRNRDSDYGDVIQDEEVSIEDGILCLTRKQRMELIKESLEKVKKSRRKSGSQKKKMKVEVKEESSGDEDEDTDGNLSEQNETSSVVNNEKDDGGKREEVQIQYLPPHLQANASRRKLEMDINYIGFLSKQTPLYSSSISNSELISACIAKRMERLRNPAQSTEYKEEKEKVQVVSNAVEQKGQEENIKSEGASMAKNGTTLKFWLRKLFRDNCEEIDTQPEIKGREISMEKANKVLNALIVDESSDIFREPVDDTMRGLENYSKIVLQPMDLGTIFDRLETGKYNVAVSNGEKMVSDQLVKDLALTFSNCCLFNFVEPSVCELAEKCERVCNNLLEQNGISSVQVDGCKTAYDKLNFVMLCKDLLDVLRGSIDSARLRDRFSAKNDAEKKFLKKFPRGDGLINLKTIENNLLNLNQYSSFEKDEDVVSKIRNLAKENKSFSDDCRKLFRQVLDNEDTLHKSVKLLQQCRKLESLFEREYISLLKGIRRPIDRVHWIGESIYLLLPNEKNKQEVRNLVSGEVLNASFSSDKELLFHLSVNSVECENKANEQVQTSCRLWSRSTLKWLMNSHTVNSDIDNTDIMVYGYDWVFASDISSLVRLTVRNKSGLRNISDTFTEKVKQIGVENEKIRLKSEPEKDKDKNDKTDEKLDLAKMELEATESLVENRIDRFMDQERIAKLCNLIDEPVSDSGARAASIVRPNALDIGSSYRKETVAKLNVGIEHANKKRNLNEEVEYVITLHKEIQLGRKSSNLQSLPFKLGIDKATGRIVVKSREVTTDNDNSPFKGIEVNDVLYSLDGIVLKGKNSASDAEEKLRTPQGKCVFEVYRSVWIQKLCTLKRIPIDPNSLYAAVQQHGGYQMVVKKSWWQEVRKTLGLAYATSSGHQLRRAYNLYFEHLGTAKPPGDPKNIPPPRSISNAPTASATSAAPNPASLSLPKQLALGGTPSSKTKVKKRNKKYYGKPPRPLKGLVGYPPFLQSILQKSVDYDSSLPRIEPLGYDRHFNQYWHFMPTPPNVNNTKRSDNMDEEDEGDEENETLKFYEIQGVELCRSILFVELHGHETEQNGNTYKGKWLEYSSRSQLDSLIARLDRNRFVERKLYSSLAERYDCIVSSMRANGVEYSAPPPLAGDIETNRIIDCKPIKGLQMYISSSPFVMGGAPFITSIKCKDSDTKDSSKACDFLVGDVILEVDGCPVTKYSPKEIVALMEKTMNRVASDAVNKDSSFRVSVYRPKPEAFHQANMLKLSTSNPNDFLSGIGSGSSASSANSSVVDSRQSWRALQSRFPIWPAKMIRPLSSCDGPKLSFFFLVGRLEELLWNLGNIDHRILHSLKEWRWLHGWGKWNWTSRRTAWRNTIALLDKKDSLDIPDNFINSLSNTTGIVSENKKMTRFDLAVAALRTLCRAYISTMPPVHPDCYLTGEASNESGNRIDPIYEAIMWETASSLQVNQFAADNEKFALLHPKDGFKLSQALEGMPVEGDWLRELHRARTFSQLSLLSSWLYTEAVARFSSAVITANRNQSRLRDYNRQRHLTYRRTRKDKLADLDVWSDVRKYQKDAQSQVYGINTDNSNNMEVSKLSSSSQEDQEVDEGKEKESDNQEMDEGYKSKRTRKSVMANRFSPGQFGYASKNATTLDGATFLSDLNGVSEVRNRYKADLICNDGVERLVGRYETAVLAALAHDAAARSHYEIKEAEKITNFPYNVSLELMKGFNLDISNFFRSLEQTVIEEDEDPVDPSQPKVIKEDIPLPPGVKRGRGRPRKHIVYVYANSERKTESDDASASGNLQNQDENKEGSKS